MTKASFRAVSAAVFLVAATPLALAGGYNESTSGDLSTDRLNPTPVSLSLGSNFIEGTSGYTSQSNLDRDFFSITLAPDQVLSEIILGPNTQVGGSASFFGFQAGTQITVDPDTVSSGATLLGWHIYSSADKGTNILDEMGGGADKIGFTGPLPAGTYTFWIQELAPILPVTPPEPYPPYPYQFDFRVAAVPEPSTYALIGLGLGMVGFALNRPARKSRLG